MEKKEYFFLNPIGLYLLIFDTKPINDFTIAYNNDNGGITR